MIHGVEPVLIPTLQRGVPHAATATVLQSPTIGRGLAQTLEAAAVGQLVLATATERPTERVDDAVRFWLLPEEKPGIQPRQLLDLSRLVHHKPRDDGVVLDRVGEVTLLVICNVAEVVDVIEGHLRQRAEDLLLFVPRAAPPIYPRPVPSDDVLTGFAPIHLK